MLIKNNGKHMETLVLRGVKINILSGSTINIGEEYRVCLPQCPNVTEIIQESRMLTEIDPYSEKTIVETPTDNSKMLLEKKKNKTRKKG